MSRGAPGSGSGSGGDLQPITAQYHGVVRTNQRPVSPVSAEVVVATVVGELAHSWGHLQPGAGGQEGNTGSLMGSLYSKMF